MNEEATQAIKDFEKAMIAKFEELCVEVRNDPNLGNSSKSKKDNFLDGAEIMLTAAQYYRSQKVAK
jgi:hypothetical protein